MDAGSSGVHSRPFQTGARFSVRAPSSVIFEVAKLIDSRKLVPADAVHGIPERKHLGSPNSFLDGGKYERRVTGDVSRSPKHVAPSPSLGSTSQTKPQRCASAASIYRPSRQKLRGALRHLDRRRVGQFSSTDFRYRERRTIGSVNRVARQRQLKAAGGARAACSSCESLELQDRAGPILAASYGFSALASTRNCVISRALTCISSAARIVPEVAIADARLRGKILDTLDALLGIAHTRIAKAFVAEQELSVLPALVLLADEIFGWNPDIVKEDLVGFIASVDPLDRADCQTP